jgi:hypothetical protein
MDERKVRFSDKVTVFHIAKDQEKGPWETVALDRHRFERRIKNMEPVLKPFIDNHLRVFYASRKECS